MDTVQIGLEKLKSGYINEAVEMFKRSYFEEGDVRAGCYLAQVYYDKNIPPKDRVHDYMAMMLWHITASKGKASSKHRLGIAYQKSERISTKQKGEEYLKSAYEGGHDGSAIVLGLIYYMKNDYAQACAYFSKATSVEKDKTAFFAYAESLIKKTNPDVHKGIQMLRVSALEHHVPEAANLLYRLYTGDEISEVKKDENEMTRYLKLRADLDDPKACEEYGLKIYKEEDSYDGKMRALSYLEKVKDELSLDGVLAIAYIYWRDCKDMNKAESTYLRALKMSPGNIAVNYGVGRFYFYTDRINQAIPYLVTAFNNGNDFAAEILFDAYIEKNDFQNAAKVAVEMERKNLTPQNKKDYFNFIIGYAYAYGKFGFEEDIVHGVSFLVCAAEAGNINAMDVLGEIYIAFDDAVGLNKKEIEQWLLKSYETGSRNAAYYLGEFYIKDYQANQAVKWLTRAYDEFGDKDAANKLAILYENGLINGKKDKKNAKLWRDRADVLNMSDY